MVIPINFRKAPDTAVASYDFIDLASGTGYIPFYAGKVSGSGVLSNYKYYSDTLSSSATIADISGSWITGLDDDFDVLINKPTTFKGIALVNIPLDTPNDLDIRAIIKMRKWTGSTETEIAQGITSPITTSATIAMKSAQFTIPTTNFKKGDYLRLTIVLQGANATNVGETIRYAHDPMERTWLGGASVPSSLVFFCPVRIDL